MLILSIIRTIGAGRVIIITAITITIITDYVSWCHHTTVAIRCSGGYSWDQFTVDVGVSNGIFAFCILTS